VLTSSARGPDVQVAVGVGGSSSAARGAEFGAAAGGRSAVYRSSRLRR